MISDPIVYVECDNEGCDYSEEYVASELDTGDFSDVKGEAESNGWYFVDETCYCEECREDFE